MNSNHQHRHQHAKVIAFSIFAVLLLSGLSKNTANLKATHAQYSSENRQGTSRTSRRALEAVPQNFGMAQEENIKNTTVHEEKHINKTSWEKNINKTSWERDVNGETSWVQNVNKTHVQIRHKYRQNVTQTSSLINDKTLRWDSHMERPWIMQNPDLSDSEHEPRFQILLTNIGWNHPDQNYALKKHPRGKRETYLMEGVVNHPLFHPTGWDDIESGRAQVRDDVYYYVFFDKFQCMDHHWPVYGGTQEDNMDTKYNRTILGDKGCWRMHGCKDLGPLFNNSRLFQSTKNARLVYIDCLAWGHEPMHENKTREWPISLATMETIAERMEMNKDLGLPPPAVKPVTLSPEQVAGIENCSAEENRKWYLTYWGNFRSGRNQHFSARRGLRKLHNETEKVIIMNYRQIKSEHKYSACGFCTMTVLALLLGPQ